MSATTDSVLPRRRVRGCDDLQEELDAEEIFVDADDAAAFRLGSGNAVKLSRFFDRAVERRLRMDGASIRSISTNALSSGIPVDATSYGNRSNAVGSSSPNMSERRRVFHYPASKNYHAD